MSGPIAAALQVSFPLHNTSALSRLMRTMDWSKSPIGLPETWSPSLKTTVGMLLAAQAQIVLFWGAEYVALYNDAYAPTIGDKHPRALGRPAIENWSELWDDLAPLLRGVRETGKTFSARDRPFYIERHGYGETVYFDVSYSAVPEVDGSVGGVLCIVSETTRRVIGARRQWRLLQLEDALRDVHDADAAKQIAVELLCDELDAQVVQYAYLDTATSTLRVTHEQRTDGLPSSVGMDGVDGNSAPVHLESNGQPSIRTCEQADLCRATALPAPAGKSDVAPCMLDLPVSRGGEVVGAFSVRCGRPCRWTDEEVQFARSVAERAWAASERARAETLLQESEVRQRLDAERVQSALAAGAIIGTWVFDIRNDRVTVDEQFAASFGLDPALGREALRLEQIVAAIHPDDRAAMQQAAADAIKRGGPYSHQYRVKRADGQYYWIEASGYVSRSEDGTPISFPGVLIDIEERRRAEQRVAVSEAKFHTLFEEIDEGFCLIEFRDGPDGALSDYVHVEANAAYAANTGLPDVVGKRVREVLPDEAESWIELYRNVLLTGESVRFERELLATGRYLELAAFRMGPPDRRQVAVLSKDVTARKRAEAELHLANRELAERVVQVVEQREAALARMHEMQKLETIGQLTGGVAHDFNNLLTPIVGALDIVSRQPAIEDRVRRVITVGQQAAERARTLVQRLLAFARRQHLETRPTDIRQLVCGMEDLLKRSLGPGIALKIECARELPPAMIDPNQFELALLNLAVNARDAMPRGGELKIAVSEGLAPHQSKLPQGRYLRITVSDTGAGMDADTIKRAVEPFFTTKAKGQGTGLGLSMVHGLAAQSGGNFVLSSVVGRGTTATLWLPASTEQLDAGSDQVATKIELRRVPPTPVLLVDDEELVRAGTAEMLMDSGYIVHQASSGHQALAMLRDGLQVKALITDYAMPGMTGIELAREAARLRPALAILLITGFASLDDGSIGDLPRLPKPFRQAELMETLSELLQQQLSIEH